MSKLLEALSANYWYDEQENLLVNVHSDDDGEHKAHPVDNFLDYRYISGSDPIVARMMSALRTPKPGEVWAVRPEGCDLWEVGIVDEDEAIETVNYYFGSPLGVEFRFVAEGVPA